MCVCVCVCQCEGGRHYSVTVCALSLSPLVLCLSKVEPLPDGSSPWAHLFLFFFSVWVSGEEATMLFLVKCRCHVDPCTFSHGRLQCCVLSPVYRGRFCECLVNCGMRRRGPSLTVVVSLFFCEIVAVEIACVFVCVRVHFSVCARLLCELPALYICGLELNNV